MKITQNYKFFIIPSILILLAGLIVGIVAGPNFGIDFTGGSIFTIEMGQDFEVEDVTAALEAQGLTNVPVVKSGSSADARTQAVLRMQPFGSDEEENAARQAVIDTLRTDYPNVAVGGVDRVGAVASSDLIRNALLSISIAAVLMLIYIWIRFELQSGIAAVICLLHDIFIMFAMTVILRVQINSTFIAAVLTILGYSINNTIVIFDRVRENRAHVSSRGFTPELVDQSIKNTLSRSINTTITTMITICALYVFSVDSIREFALPIIIGLVAGTYSSIFLAAPTWYMLQSKKGGKKA